MYPVESVGCFSKVPFQKECLRLICLMIKKYRNLKCKNLKRVGSLDKTAKIKNRIHFKCKVYRDNDK